MARDLLKLLMLFLLYAFFLLLDQPIKDILATTSLSDIKIASVGTILKLLPLMVFLIWLLKKFNLEDFNGIKEGFLPENRKFLWIPFIFLVFVVLNNFSAFKYPDADELLLYLIGLLLVGFTEEFFFRGILFPRFIKLFKNKKNSVLLAVILSSLLFGLLHYNNLFFKASFSETTFQVIGAFCMGVLLCGLLLKTKSILIPALVHSIWNLNETIGIFRFFQIQPAPEVGVSNEIANVPQMIFSEIMIKELPTLFFLLILGALLIFMADRRERYLIATRE